MRRCGHDIGCATRGILGSVGSRAMRSLITGGARSIGFRPRGILGSVGSRAMRYLITGGSGYIGSRLVELLARREDTEKIVIADVVPPRGGYRPKTEFERVDVRDRGAVHSALQRANPDVL